MNIAKALSNSGSVFPDTFMLLQGFPGLWMETHLTKVNAPKDFAFVSNTLVKPHLYLGLF